MGKDFDINRSHQAPISRGQDRKNIDERANFASLEAGIKGAEDNANVIIPRNGIRTQSRSIEGRTSHVRKGGHKDAMTDGATKASIVAKHHKLF